MTPKAPKRATGIKVSIAPLDDYEVRDAANTIARAESHKANKPLMAKVRKHVAGLSAAVGRK